MDLTAGLVAGSGWASGLSLYLVVAVLGIAQRLGVDAVPGGLGHPLVIGVAVALYAVEFLADKVPWLDSAWDALHTLIRPGGAAVLGSLITDGELAAALGAGGLALLSHATKATLRAVVNASPEPVSNIALSLTEDGMAGGTVVLALLAPALALVLVAVLTAGSFAVLVAVWRWRRRRRRGATVPRASDRA